MATITLKGNTIHTSGELPDVGETAPDFTLVKDDLSEVSLHDYKGKRKVLNIFPSVDTSVCAQSVRQFNEKAASLDNVAVLCISCDLPFAFKRFCEAEGVESVESLSAFRSPFPVAYGVKVVDGPLQGLCSRAVLTLDEDNKVLHAQQVPEITEEPDYDKALGSLQ